MSTIRTATPSDAEAIARVYVDSWRSTYAGLLPDEVLLRLDATQREARWWRHALVRHRRSQLVLVADDATDGIVGFVSGGSSRDRRLSYDGEIYTLYLRDEYQGAGIGKRLFMEMTQRLAGRCGQSLVVWVLKDNPSRFFYEALGGRCVAHRPGSMGGAPIAEIAYGWEDVRETITLGKSGETG